MTDINDKKIDNKENSQRTWLEKNGPTVYGISVFAALALFMTVHLLLSN
ncbi:MAG: hypothetical protein JXX14_25840 [Deltaproteobacteria bacterium]|nr:hypothetical protein [Deltaproteobacteria bacterium]